MKRMLILMTVWLVLFPLVGMAAQTAQARMHCLSVRVHRGSAVDNYGFLWTMDMTSISAGLNGELAPDFFGSGYTNSTFVEIYDDFLEEILDGILVVDLPDLGDANGNGIFDFFEVSQGFTGASSPGAYSIDFIGNGSFTATWSREAGSSVGFCVIPIRDPYSPSRQLTFVHAFEVLEYTGSINYTPGAESVTGEVDLSLTSDTPNWFRGPILFEKTEGADRFNELTLESVLWTNMFEQTVDLYIPTTFLRGTAFPTNYQGLVELNDGDPNTFEDDYYTWALSINDANDSDGDGIPDFSDDPFSPLPRRPQLSLAHTSTNLLLTIRGDVGSTCQILEANTITAVTWPVVMTIPLTNDPQTVSLPLPAGGMKFWRARAQ